VTQSHKFAGFHSDDCLCGVLLDFDTDKFCGWIMPFKSNMSPQAMPTR